MVWKRAGFPVAILAALVVIVSAAVIGLEDRSRASRTDYAAGSTGRCGFEGAVPRQL